MSTYTDFLKSVEALGENYASIELNGQLESLTLYFWSWQEIQKGLSMREEWDVPISLVPFYGDWHDLICLEESTGKVVAINDQREVEHTWPSTEAFLSALRTEELESDGDSGIVSAWYDF